MESFYQTAHTDPMLIVIKGAGDIASGISFRLWHAGFDIVMTEIAEPLAVRRTVSFSQAVYQGEVVVEDVTAVLVKDKSQIRDVIAKKQIAVIVDPAAAIINKLKDSGEPPAVLVDAIMAKKNTGTSLGDAPVVIAAGPGFIAGIDCHAVIETMRGHTLGRVITKGSALPYTGTPGEIDGVSVQRLLRCGADGIFQTLVEIGSSVKKGDAVALVRSAGSDSAAGDMPILAGINGIVRGLLPSGVKVTKGLKAGDIDPRCETHNCFTVSDKALAIGGAVLEAILCFYPLKK